MIGSTVKLGFDGTAVQRGFGKVATGFKALGRTVANIGRTMLAPFAKLMAVLAPIMGAAGMARGIKDIVAYGSAVSDLATRTGLAADQIVVLQELFRRTGLRADNVATVLQRMGRRTFVGLSKGTGEYADALRVLGLTQEDLAGLNLADMFELIAGRMSKLTNEGRRANVAMALFGDDGFKLVNTFKNAPAAFDMARKSVGKLGSNLNLMADNFDHISDALGAIGMKFRQFFAGLATEMLPVLNKMADTINELDLSDLGQQAGKFLEMIHGAFAQGRFGELIWESFKYAAAKLGEFLASVMEYAMNKALAALAKTELGKKLGMGKGANEHRFVTLPNGNKVIQANYRTYADTPENRASILGQGMSFSDVMSNNKGMFGSTEAAASLRTLSKTLEANTRQEAWLEKIGWSNEQIASAMKDMKRKKSATAF